MKVYWKADERNNHGLPGRKQRIDYRFAYAGKLRCIPAIYRFPEGIVFDILTILDEAELHAFHEKYRDTESMLASAKRRAAMDEHPYQAVPLEKVRINGKLPPGGWSSTSRFYVPWLEGQLQPAKEVKAYKEQLSGVSCFVCERYTLPLCTGPVSTWERLWRWLAPEQISSIEIKTGETTRFLPIELSFTLSRDFFGVHTETFLHPKTQILHTLYFQGIKHEEIQIPAGNGKKTVYIVWLSYEIDPELPTGDRLQFDGGIHEPESTEANGDDLHSAAAIGVIGGSDGPTAVFVTGRSETGISRGIHGLPLHCCLAKPSTKNEAAVSVVLDGIDTKWLDAEMFSWERKA